MKSTYSTFPKRNDRDWPKRRATLLEMALAREKRFWLPGEKLLIWSGADPARRAYLIEKDGVVYLVLGLFPDIPCVVFQEDPFTSFWDVDDDLSSRYEAWKEQVRARIRVARGTSGKGFGQSRTEAKSDRRLINGSYSSKRRGRDEIKIKYKTTESRLAG